MAQKPPPVSEVETFTPRRATLLAIALLTAWVLLLCLPMLGGRFLASPDGDQMWTGVPIRWFGANEWRRTGEVALWNPYMFGGLPFVGATHGDIFYPTAFLRLFLPIDVAMNLGFATHLVLAGVFAFLFFRALQISWTGSLVGGVAYQLSGIVASLVHPGHDGKLFVSALMPLALLGLLTGVRRGRLEGYAIFALAAGLCIICPHLQMAQYMLILAGFFTLYLAFWSMKRPEALEQRWTAVALATGGVVIAFGAAMIQLLPFIQYMPYAARSAGAQGWEYATSWSMPPANIVDWLVPEFTGILGSYWGENPLKLHSEYIGAAVLVLASIGIGNSKRPHLRWFAAAMFALFLLVALGGHTPFYRLWYAVVPGAKVTRAAGMAFYIPTFIAALMAALGVERLEEGGTSRAPLGWLIGAGVLLLLGASGALGSLAAGWADAANPWHPAVDLARDNSDAIAFGSVRSALFAAAAAGLAIAALKGRLRALPLALALVVLVGADLFINARRFFEYSSRAAEIYADDPITRRIETTPVPFRALDPQLPGTVYPAAFLMAKGIPNVLGHHGNELNSYDQLMGGKNVWQYVNGGASALRLWDLLAVRYVLLPQDQAIPGYHRVLGPATTGQGRTVFLFERDSVPAYARVIPAAAKLPSERIVPTLLDQRLDVRRVVLLPDDAPIQFPRLDSLPAPSTLHATVAAWEPGRMTIRLDSAADRSCYLMVSENWYPDWRATVDGQPAQALRGDHTFITVPLPRGAREVQLVFRSDGYRTGAGISFASLAGILIWLVLPPLLRRRRG